MVLGSAGESGLALGDVSTPVLPRSCANPVQALATLRCGLRLEPELLALACASHSGEPFHLQGMRRLLEGVEPIRAAPRLVAEDGAEAVSAVGPTDGRGVALEAGGRGPAGRDRSSSPPCWRARGSPKRPCPGSRTRRCSAMGDPVGAVVAVGL